MGATFSSNQLAGAVSNGVPTVSYAYSSGNTKLFSVDATYIYSAPFTQSDIYTPIGLVTPYLIQESAPTLTCNGFYAEQSRQVLKCPVTGAKMATGLYTISFSQYTSTTTVDQNGFTHFVVKPTSEGGPPNTLANYGAAVTFSMVAPQTVSTSTVTITPTPTAMTTVTSGISEVPATTTATVPSTIQTVTVYQKTIISTSTSLSTLNGATAVTVTGTCSTKSSSSSTTSKVKTTMLTCNKDNCLRALINKSAGASSFCSNYLKTSALPTPTYASQCAGLTSRVSSACSCIVVPTVAPAKRGGDFLFYGAPDFTYNSAIPVTTVYVGPVTTEISGPFPSDTVTDLDSTVSFGTSTSTDSELSTVTVTIYQSTVDLRTASTVTVAPTNCALPS